MTRDEILNILHKSVTTVIFTKKDGTERTMVCTLKEELLPERKEVKEDVDPKPVNLEIIKVFDMEVNAWRSFRVDSVKSVQGSH